MLIFGVCEQKASKFMRSSIKCHQTSGPTQLTEQLNKRAAPPAFTLGEVCFPFIPLESKYAQSPNPHQLFNNMMVNKKWLKISVVSVMSQRFVRIVSQYKLGTAGESPTQHDLCV